MKDVVQHLHDGNAGTSASRLQGPWSRNPNIPVTDCRARASPHVHGEHCVKVNRIQTRGQAAHTQLVRRVIGFPGQPKQDAFSRRGFADADAQALGCSGCVAFPGVVIKPLSSDRTQGQCKLGKASLAP